MSIVVDQLEALVTEALPGEPTEKADYLRQLINRLSLTADDLDPQPTDTVAASPTVLAVGNPIDGLHLIGPFGDSEDAYTYTERTALEEWWAVTLTAPEPIGEPR